MKYSFLPLCSPPLTLTLLGPRFWRVARSIATPHPIRVVTHRMSRSSISSLLVRCPLFLILRVCSCASTRAHGHPKLLWWGRLPQESRTGWVRPEEEGCCAEQGNSHAQVPVKAQASIQGDSIKGERQRPTHPKQAIPSEECTVQAEEASGRGAACRRQGQRQRRLCHKSSLCQCRCSPQASYQSRDEEGQKGYRGGQTNGFTGYYCASAPFPSGVGVRIGGSVSLCSCLAVYFGVDRSTSETRASWYENEC